MISRQAAADQIKALRQQGAFFIAGGIRPKMKKTGEGLHLAGEVAENGEGVAG